MAATDTPSAKACNEACVACRGEEEQQPTHPAARGRKVTGMLEVTAVHIAAAAEAAARAASQTNSTEGAEPEEGATGYPWMQGVGDLHVELPRVESGIEKEVTEGFVEALHGLRVSEEVPRSSSARTQSLPTYSTAASWRSGAPAKAKHKGSRSLLRAFNANKYKTTLCSRWLKGTPATCEFGERCWFAHGEDDLATEDKPRAPEQWMLDEMLEESRQRERAFNARERQAESAAAAAASERSERRSETEASGLPAQRRGRRHRGGGGGGGEVLVRAVRGGGSERRTLNASAMPFVPVVSGCGPPSPHPPVVPPLGLPLEHFQLPPGMRPPPALAPPAMAPPAMGTPCAFEYVPMQLPPGMLDGSPGSPYAPGHAFSPMASPLASPMPSPMMAPHGPLSPRHLPHYPPHGHYAFAAPLPVPWV